MARIVTVDAYGDKGLPEGLRKALPCERPTDLEEGGR